jgi:hypothetical protein
MKTVRTSQETLYISATMPKRLMLFKEAKVYIVRTMRNTEKDSLEITQNFCMLKLVVHIMTTEF